MNKDIGLLASDKLICIHKNKSMKQAHDLMKNISARHLPVVGDQGTIIGMISDRDVKRSMEIHRWEAWSAEEAKPYFNSEDSVIKFMSWPIQTIEENVSIAQAAETMIENKISSLIVTKDKRAVGIVTSEDLLSVLLSEHKSSSTTMKDSIVGAIYRSPIGSIANLLSNIGI